MTFILVNIQTGELLCFDTPIHIRGAEAPKIPTDMLGYEPGNLDDLRVIVYSGNLFLDDARALGIRYDFEHNQLIDKRGNIYNVSFCADTEQDPA